MERRGISIGLIIVLVLFAQKAYTKTKLFSCGELIRN